MSNELALTFEGAPWRIIVRDGDPWIMLVDVCEVLGVGSTSNVADRLDDDEKSTIDSIKGGPPRLIISEAGLYKVLQTSNKPIAKRLDRWNRHEVLPEIRRTGSYLGHSSHMLQDLFDQGVAIQNHLMAVESKVDRVDGNVIHLRDRCDSMQGDITLLRSRVDDMAPRHKFTANTIRMWIHVIKEMNSSKCPCCRKIKIIHDGRKIDGIVQDDHFNGRERNTPQDGWLVCVGCNLKLRDDAKFKEDAKPHFRVFQDNLALMFGTARKQSSRKRSSKTVKNNAQFSMGFMGE